MMCLATDCRIKVHPNRHTRATSDTFSLSLSKVLNSSSVCELTSSKIKFEGAEQEQQRKFAITIYPLKHFP